LLPGIFLMCNTVADNDVSYFTICSLSFSDDAVLIDELSPVLHVIYCTMFPTELYIGSCVQINVIFRNVT